MRKSKAFTLIELLVVVAIIALLISILLPSLSRARELSKRTVCAANENGLGKAFWIYAADPPEQFPAITSTNTANPGPFQMFMSNDRTTEPSTTGTPSPTVDMWAIVRANNTTPKQYICPSTADVSDPAQDTTVYYDFLSLSNISYGYQWQHANQPNRRIIGTSSEPTFPILADGNPYVKGGVSTALAADRTGQGRGNSANHTNREGQNVLYQDGHVTFEKGPDCGLSGKVSSGVTMSRGKDNIYTYFRTVTDAVDYGTDRPTWTLGSSGTVGLGGKSDACLIP